MGANHGGGAADFNAAAGDGTLDGLPEDVDASFVEHHVFLLEVKSGLLDDDEATFPVAELLHDAPEEEREVFGEGFEPLPFRQLVRTWGVGTRCGIASLWYGSGI